jgi:hypothetical protein
MKKEMTERGGNIPTSNLISRDLRRSTPTLADEHIFLSFA